MSTRLSQMSSVGLKLQHPWYVHHDSGTLSQFPQMHVFLHYPSLVPLPSRRPQKTAREVDWVEMLDFAALRTGEVPDRTKGQKVARFMKALLHVH